MWEWGPAFPSPESLETHMCNFILPSSRESAVCDSDTPRFIPMTGWVPAMGVQKVKLLFQLVTRSDGFSACPAIQMAATDPDSPSPFQPLLTDFLSDTEKHCSGILDVSVPPFSIDEVFFVRFGMAVRGNGTGLQSGEMALTVSARL